MKKNPILLTAIAALVASGCRTPAPKVSTSASPAQSSAAESPLPPAAPFLMTGNNYAIPPEAEGQPMKMDMKMDMKDMPEHKAPPGNTPQHEDHEKASAKAAATPGTPEHHHDIAPKQ